MINPDRIDAFWSKVDKNGPIQPNMDTPCWLWTAGKFQDGYGAFYYNGKTWKSYRFSLYIIGRLVPGIVCHSCHTPACVNPDHLYIGSHSDNMLDRSTGPNKDFQSGMRNHQCVLTDEQVVEIRSRLNNGERGCKLAREFDISEAHISRIKHRQVRN